MESVNDKIIKIEDNFTNSRFSVVRLSDVKESVLKLKSFINEKKFNIEDEKYYDDQYISVSDLIEYIDLINFGDLKD